MSGAIGTSGSGQAESHPFYQVAARGCSSHISRKKLVRFILGVKLKALRNHSLKVIAWIISIATGGFVLVAILQRLGPGSAELPLFNSDSAIPVLMSNSSYWRGFDAFYWGQDRFGAWPFLLIRCVAHGHVTPEILQAWVTFGLLLGLVPAYLLGLKEGLLAAMAYLLVILVPDLRSILFDMSQPYCWQIPALLMAWWSIRRLADPTQSGYAYGQAIGWCVLATWLASTSGPLLLIVTASELGLIGSARRWRIFIPSVVGMIFELGLRVGYDLWVTARWKKNFRTEIHLDLGHLIQNVLALWTRISDTKIWLSLFLVGALMGVCCVISRRKPSDLRGLEKTLRGTFLMSTAVLLMLLLLSHVRLNQYSLRYFAPAVVFSRWGGLVGASALSLSWVGERRKRIMRVFWVSVFAVSSLGFLPHREISPKYQAMRATAQAIARDYPGAFLIDGYWNSYVYAALAPPGLIKPLPVSGDWDREPWLESELPHGSAVLAGYSDFLQPPETSHPPRYLLQHDTLLELSDQHIQVEGDQHFSRYHVLAADRVGHLDLPRILGMNLRIQTELTLTPALSFRGGRVGIQLECPRLSSDPAATVEDPTGIERAAEVESVPFALLIQLPVQTLNSLLKLRFGVSPCTLRSAVWFKN